MAIITLTTDLGDKDFYQAALKGALYSLLPGVNIVDVTHNISPFNISQAAFVIKNAYHYFPKGSVHLIGIDGVFSESRKYLAVKYNDHFFIGSDNGIFSLILEGQKAQEIWELNIMQDLRHLHFPLTDIFAKAACHLSAGNNAEEIGVRIQEIDERSNFQPTIEKDLIKGTIIYIDSYQNAITNISKDLFTSIQSGRNFVLNFKRNETITRLSWHYNEVPEGEKLCLFGISNYLEIAINKGKASGLLGLSIGDIVRVEFLG